MFPELPELPALLLDEAVSEAEFSEPFFSEDFSLLPSLSESFCASATSSLSSLSLSSISSLSVSSLSSFFFLSFWPSLFELC